MRTRTPKLILLLLAILVAIPAQNQQKALSSSGRAASKPVKKAQPDLSSNAVITTFAGDGHPGLTGDGGPATSASLYAPFGAVSDSKGNIYTTDDLPYEAGVRKIDVATGIITTYAGGVALEPCTPYPSCINGSPATSAAINPFYLAIDSSDNLYISDQSISVIWKVEAKTQAITVYAGVGPCGSGNTCYSGDGGPATQAEMDLPTGMAFDASNNLYFSDYGNVVIREINGGTGVIDTVPGSVAAGFSEPLAVSFDINGNLLVADLENIKIYDASSGSFSELVGSGSGCAAQTDSEGDGCPASDAAVGKPLGIALDSAGDIFISDAETENIRVIDGTSGIITVAAGNGTAGYSGDGGPALDAEFNAPYQINFDPSGNLYIADSGNEVVREIHYGGTGTQTVATPTFSPAAGTFTAAQSITIIDATTGATIYYTTDGSTPTTSSSAYGGAIAVSDTTTIKAIATKSGDTQSAVATATYTIQALIPTQLTLTGNPNPGTAGQAVTFAAVVKPSSGTGTPTGTITTTVDGSAGPSLTLSSGSATFISSSLTAGSHTIVATYGGDSNYAGSSATLVETITSPASAATPTFTPGAGTYSSAQSVTISDATNGAVIYYTTNGTAPTTSSTQYSGPIPVGATETIEAIAAAPGYSNSAVATATYTINIPAPSFSLTSSPSSATVSSSQSATITLTVTPSNEFTQTVSFACTGLPTGYGCSFAPSTVTPAGAAVNSKLTIASNASASTSHPLLWRKAGAGLALALLAWPFAWRKNRYRLAMLLLLAGAFTLVGCGGSPKSQSYTVTVTASGGGITQTSSINLTVNQ